jgi:lipoprotein-releasing system permease protein
LGLVIGLSICFLQQKYGFVKLGMQYALVDAYPVKIAWMDIFWSVFWVASISVVASIIPAKRAVNYMLKF